MSLACLAFLLVAGTMMAASLILLGFTDRKLAPGDRLSGGGLRFRDEAAAAQLVPLLAEGILPGALEAGGADRGPRDPSDFSPCPKRGRAAAGHAGAAGEIPGDSGAGRAGVSAGLHRPA